MLFQPDKTAFNDAMFLYHRVSSFWCLLRLAFSFGLSVALAALASVLVNGLVCRAMNHPLSRLGIRDLGIVA
jgi:hypothetical protein